MKRTDKKYYFITYGDKKYALQASRIIFQAKKFRIFDGSVKYSKRNLDSNFLLRFKDLLTFEKGGGYWIWKSQIILQQLSTISNGDIILYVDSGSTLNIKGKERLLEYFELFLESNESLFMFQIPTLIEKDWTTEEIFKVFGVESDQKIKESPQLMGGVMMIKKTNESVKFFKDFQSIVERDNNLITDHYSKYQREYFRDSRHDQSITSVMAKINGCLHLEDESYFFPGYHKTPEQQFQSPILTVRDNPYDNWQKFKYYSLYPLNKRKAIFFDQKPYYFKNKYTISKKLISAIKKLSFKLLKR